MVLQSCLQSADINENIGRHFKNFHLFWKSISLVKCLHYFLRYFISWEKVNVIFLRTCCIRFLSWRYILTFFSFGSAFYLYFTIAVTLILMYCVFIKQQCTVFLRNSWIFLWNCLTKLGILRWWNELLKIGDRAWVQAPVVLATWETDMGGSREPRSLGTGVSYDHAILLHPGWKSETQFIKKKKKGW